MATSSLKVPLTTQGITLQVRVTGVTSFRVRTWLGSQLLKLAAWVIGLTLELSIGGPPGPAPRPSLAVPPIRLSVADLGKPDRPVTWEEAARIQVMLDGVEVRDVLAYDCEAGTVERQKRDRAGELVVQDGNLVTEVVSGEVIAQIRQLA